MKVKDKDHWDLYLIIKEYVDDHKRQFDCYPVDVEVNDVVFNWDQYWEILNDE